MSFKDLPLYQTPLCSNSSDLLCRAEFPGQVRLSHSDSSTKIWEGFCLERPSGVCGLRERCTTEHHPPYRVGVRQEAWESLLIDFITWTFILSGDQATSKARDNIIFPVVAKITGHVYKLLFVLFCLSCSCLLQYDQLMPMALGRGGRGQRRTLALAVTHLFWFVDRASCWLEPA